MVGVEGYTVVALVSGGGGESDGLAVGGGFAEGVFDIDVVDFGVGGPVADGAGGVVAGGGAEGEAVGYGYLVGGVGGGVFGVAVDG